MERPQEGSGVPRVQDQDLAGAQVGDGGVVADRLGGGGVHDDEADGVPALLA